MSSYDKLVKLLSQTDGRDKVYKFLAGLTKLIAAIAATPDAAKPFLSLNKSIGEGRSLMRMAKWTGDVTKLDKLLSKGLGSMSANNYVEFIRVIGNFGYVFGDNVGYLVKHKLVAGNAKVIQKVSKTFQFWGFLFAAILDVLAIQSTVSNKGGDEKANKAQLRASLINIVRNIADVLVTMSAVGYCKSVWQPSGVTSGALTMVSGGIATYQNWKKVK